MRSTQSHNFISVNPIQAGNPTPDTYVSDYAKSATPVPVHSHNDYWRPHPLYSALAAGCMGVEADVWLTPDKTDLLVGHHPSELSAHRTLQSLYIDPIKQILDRLNAGGTSSGDAPGGIYPTSPGTTLMLLIDVKGNASEIWPLVDRQLQPLRQSGYLSRLEHGAAAAASPPVPVFRRGAVTVVGTGNLAQSDVTGAGCDALSRYPDTFLDAPLGALANGSSYATLPGCEVDSLLGLPLAKFYLASAPFARQVGSFRVTLSPNQRGLVRDSLRAAEARNLTSRYWSTPAWPISRRDYIWQELFDQGVGLLNADDIESATRLEWSKAYKAELVWMGVSSAYIFAASLVTAWLYSRSRRRSQDEHRRGLTGRTRPT